MKLLLCRHLWGVEEDWDSFFAKAAAFGYGAIDTPFWDPANISRASELLPKHGLKLVAMIATGGETVSDHLKSFEKQRHDLAPLKPVRWYAHSGVDRFSEAQQDEFFGEALRMAPEVGHETHRGRILYNPWTTARLIAKFPALRINADLSHWVCVAERLLDGEGEILKAVAERSDHIHARVGYEEGPQVPDPRAPQYKAHVEAHERWWDMIWDSQARRGLEFSSLTPEFGPAPYMQTRPEDNQPVAPLAEICDWQAARQKKRFESRFS